MSAPLMQRSWKEGHVYLVQFPRTGSIPSPSPFALQLETWLRMMDIPYTNVSNNLSRFSVKGMIPFVEFNGREVPDSNQIIEYLRQQFHRSDGEWLNEQEKATALAFHALIEDSLRWCLVYSRVRNSKWLSSPDGFGNHFKGMKKVLLETFGPGQFAKTVGKTIHAQGIGRHSQEEVTAMAKRDLDAISTFLGEKTFFLGDKPSKLDATAFGHLAQFYWGPARNDEVKDYLDQKTPNIVSYLKRMREKYWPDWEETCKTLNMNINAQ